MPDCELSSMLMAASCHRCVEESGYWLLLAADEAEQHAVVYCLAAAASVLTYAVIILVPESGPEGAALHQALSAHYASSEATAWHEVRMMGAENGSWDSLIASRIVMQGFRQGALALLVPNCRAALAHLQRMLTAVNPSQIVVLATAMAVPSPEQEPQSLHGGLPCSAFIQVCCCCHCFTVGLKKHKQHAR